MQNTQKVLEDLIYVGVSDRRLSLFENVYPVPNGVSYNSYLLLDQQTVLFDTADSSVAEQYFCNVKAALNGRTLDYLVVHHMEPDHGALIEPLLMLFPDVKIVTTSKAAQMIEQFFSLDIKERLMVVKEGDSLNTGSHNLVFTMAPMVHWPEVMMTLDTTTGVLFSADAFGTFGALSGNLFADEMPFKEQWLDDARRYFTNIVGKYGMQVQNVLKKAATLNIKMICPLHGPIWREELGWFIDKYNTWSSYQPEDKTVVIIYGSIYGHTESAATHLAILLANKGVKNIKMYDASHTDVSLLVSECFRASHIVLACSTYNNGIFTPIENLLHDLQAHALQNRTWAIIENGSWAPQSGKLIRSMIEAMKDMTILDATLTLKSAMKEEQHANIETMAQQIADTLHQ